MLLMFEDELDAIALGSEHDRNGIYGNANGNMLQTLGKLGFEQIERMEREIEHIKQRLATGRIRRQKKVKARAKLEILEANLIKLRIGHKEVARKLTRRAQTLEILPREMRDTIFEHLYVREAPIEVSWSRIGDHHIFWMPKDEALYLSKFHVGEQMASEAAETFYKHNKFAFGPGTNHGGRWSELYLDNWDRVKLDSWFDTDHYGSGITPQNWVRDDRLQLRGPARYGFDNSTYTRNGVLVTPNHLEFESKYSESHYTLSFGHRQQMCYLIDMRGLHKVTIVAPTEQLSDQLLRLLNPFVRQLMEKKIQVEIGFANSWGLASVTDVSSVFDDPSADDHPLFREVTGRKMIEHNENKDPLLTWHSWSKMQDLTQDPDFWETQKPGFVRVWLLEHYQLYKWYTKNERIVKELDLMKTELEALQKESQHIRLQYYTRMIELLNPTMMGR